MSEPQGDWFTSQPATPACFCRCAFKFPISAIYEMFSCRNPFLADPYERIFVQVGKASIDHPKSLLFKNSSTFVPILGRWESDFSSRPGLVCKMRHRGGDGHQFLQRGEQWASTIMQNSKSKREQRVSTMEWAVYTKSAHIFRQLGFQHLAQIGNFY